MHVVWTISQNQLENIQMQDLYVTWDEYHRLIEQLALQIHASGYRFDSLLCLARGGLRIGDMISRIYAIPLAILAVSSYREAAGTQQGQLAIAESITTTGNTLHGKVLLVDDLVDSGVTLTRVVAHMRQRCIAITEVRTAVLWYKAASKYKPDYYVHYLPTSPWIHQPFEEYDTLYPYQLAARLHSEKG
jgi:hypoxanthine phosphoribosyltransferase